LPLHIFEPRYLQMIEDCLKTPERLIGMVQPAGERLSAIGCAGRLTGFTETEDGRYMITLSGVSRFRIRREVEGFTPYRRAEVSWGDFTRDTGAAEQDSALDRKRLYDTLCSYLEHQGLGADWEALKDAEDELLINSLSMLLPLDPADKQALLEAPSLSTRRETLLTLMEYALHGGGEDNLQ
jgi:uncharacterized protein